MATKMWSLREEEGKWGAELPVFLAEVWPRQKKAKSSRISSKLCDLAFSSVTNFSKIANIILPLLTEINREQIISRNLRKGKTDIVDQFPKETLAILFSILPDDVSAWPYDIEDTFQQIGIADSSLLKDSQLIEFEASLERSIILNLTADKHSIFSDYLTWAQRQGAFRTLALTIAWLFSPL